MHAAGEGVLRGIPEPLTEVVGDVLLRVDRLDLDPTVREAPRVVRADDRRDGEIVGFLRSLSSTAMDRRLRGERGGEGRHDGVWLVRELPRRDPDYPPAFAHEKLISSPIPFERTAH